MKARTIESEVRSLAKRNIVKINEDLCNGCGVCISPCAEGALELVDGKARVIKEELCDGAGFCMGVCPTGALTLEEREAQPFSEQAVHKIQLSRPKNYIPQNCKFCGSSENKAYLLPIKHQGKSEWVCTRCLPGLIHG